MAPVQALQGPVVGRRFPSSVQLPSVPTARITSPSRMLPRGEASRGPAFSSSIQEPGSQPTVRLYRLCWRVSVRQYRPGGVRPGGPAACVFSPIFRVNQRAPD
eukprot:3014978-Amphidinium_carterae.1